jgi:1-acyl-sn-glycerol-3-phosphate acyltransferase
MPRWFRVVVTGLCYLVFGGFGAVIAYILLPLRVLGVRDPEARALAAQDLLHVWSRRYFGFLRVVGVANPEYPAPLELPTGRGAVVIANHPSLLDVVFVMGAIPRLTYVAKESWMTSPLVGRLLRTCGHIAAPRGKTPADGAIALERMILALNAGRTLLVFPEGTRSPRRGMWRFQRGAFEAALRAGAPIVPCVIEVEPPMLRKDQPWYDVPDRAIDYRMRALPRVEPEALARSAKSVVAQLEARIRGELGLPAEPPEAPTAAAGAPP